MIQYIIFYDQTFITLITFKLHFSSMCFQMSLKITYLVKTVTTLITFKWLLSIVCNLIWISRFIFIWEVLLQILHLYGVSPMCISTWIWIFIFKWEACGFFGIWTNYIFLIKLISHWSHPNWLSSVWVFWCISKEHF